MTHKILLAEDNEMNRDMLVRRLERRGYEVLAAENGELALKMAIQHGPALILMDLNMPVMDGWEATRRLRKDDRCSATPIIALTANAMREDWKEALDAGCDMVLTKPFHFSELIEEIERWIEQGRSVNTWGVALNMQVGCNSKLNEGVNVMIRCNRFERIGPHASEHDP